jgi:HTH-type transcriptional regulator/antitoxin HipB
MHVRTARELGAAIRRRRRELGWTQARLAEAAGATRAWVIGLEQGKPGAELTLVLRALTALGLAADIVVAPVAHGGIDLDELLGDG